MSDRVKSTARVRPLQRRPWWPPLAVIAALLLVLLMWFARRPGTECVVTIAAGPPVVRVVTVPVPVAIVLPSPVPAPPPPVHVQMRAAPKPIATIAPPVVAAPPSDVTTRYRQVGQLLAAHGSDALWQRYRYIRLGDCLTTDDKRAECVRTLDAIASDAAGE